MEQESLTNEELLKHYPNQFILALHAISLAEEEIRTQSDQSFYESQNVVTVVLNRIHNGIDAMKIKNTKENLSQEHVETKVKAVA